MRSCKQVCYRVIALLIRLCINSHPCICTVMIRKNLINCNLIREKRSSKSIFDASVKELHPEREVCPVCRKKGDCRIHSYYRRYIIDFIGGTVCVRSIRVPRVKCSCGHTHAILPDPIIPYDSYSLFFILRVITEYCMRLRTVSALCERFSITPSMLYRWLKLYSDHRREWQGVLKATSQPMLDSLKELILIKPFCDLAHSFFRSTGRSFLQSHRNPAVSLRSG